MSEGTCDITEIVAVLNDVLVKLPAAVALTVLDTLVALVIYRDGLQTDTVIRHHGENIPKFVDLFRSQHRGLDS